MSELNSAHTSRLNLPFTTVEHCHYGGSRSQKEVYGEDNAFLVQVQLIRLDDYRVSTAGQEVFRGQVSEGSVSIRDLRGRWTEEFQSTFDRVSFRFGFDDLRVFATEMGRPEFICLQCCENYSKDASLYGLVEALMPSFSLHRQVDQPFLEQMGRAILVHVTQSYGRLHFPSHRKGGLSAQQEVLAIELLKGRLTEDLSLTDLAAVCGLSRSYFSKAFKTTFGKSPYRWLTEYRLAKACELLRSDMKTSHIAHVCGFTDQSHFTRVFSEVTSVTPGIWRRLSKNVDHIAGEVPAEVN